ncbi:uncharacterized protein LOC129602673 [Paramacrobiotus metropolitanus]|uniref:uncharacterized protein LOC129602673 n=1 Tax=Paramacrobiotus metropolitanus TaxID=2943436 RepID=UPI002445DC43|nr:uncharacterized protein LOC129602673 [Paramacrobiotus metropolitanus]XP_055357740.1 uncharacterized protein LOC129602673 [Paramacrobiotus metropolitanus]XP_055357741.1 uncharacterized protein LOC129602673 [Paramacrobiotus metropolitanus]
MSLCSIALSRSLAHQLRITSCSSLPVHRDGFASFSGNGILPASKTAGCDEFLPRKGMPSIFVRGVQSTASGQEQEVKRKRPPTAYNLYLKSELLAHRGGKKGEHKEAFISAAKNYKRLKTAEKKKFEDQAAQLREEYSQQKAAEEGPKRSLSSYNFYVRDQAPNRPKDQKMADYVKVLGKQFQQLDSAERAKYDQLHAKDVARYQEEKAAMPEKPKSYKRPPTSYALFLVDYGKASRGSGKAMLLSDAGVEWRAMDDARKAKYEDLAKIAKEEFKKAKGGQKPNEQKKK